MIGQLVYIIVFYANAIQRNLRLVVFSAGLRQHIINKLTRPFILSLVMVAEVKVIRVVVVITVDVLLLAEEVVHRKVVVHQGVVVTIVLLVQLHVEFIIELFLKFIDKRLTGQRRLFFVGESQLLLLAVGVGVHDLVDTLSCSDQQLVVSLGVAASTRRGFQWVLDYWR